MAGVVGDRLKRQFRFVVVRNQEAVAGGRNFKIASGKRLKSSQEEKKAAEEGTGVSAVPS